MVFHRWLLGLFHAAPRAMAGKQKGAASRIMEKYPNETQAIFIIPPSIDELRKRVIARDGGATNDLDLRMENAQKEIAIADHFHFQLVNDEFEEAYNKFKKIIENIVSMG